MAERAGAAGGGNGHCCFLRGTLIRTLIVAFFAQVRSLAVLAALWLLCVSAASAAPPAGDGDAYRLAPGDRITVTVIGQPDLSGDATIDGSGAIAVPLAGTITVRDLTVAECQRTVAQRLADGILVNPTVIVRIAELRPLYVMGDVRLPGAYPFRYGNTVRAAVALAGGFGSVDPRLPNGGVADFLAAEERVRQLALQRRILLVRQARVEAQIRGQTTFTPPSFADDDEETQAIVAHERQTFAAENAALREQIDTLKGQKPHLDEQISANSEEGTAGKKQLEMIRQQIKRYADIYKQGLGTQNNDFQYRILEANQEATVYRIESEVARLRIEAGDLGFKIQQVQSTFDRQAATQLQEIQDRLEDLKVTLPAAIRMRDAKLRYAGDIASRDVKHSITITRTRNGKTDVLDADETTLVQPGDVIDIQTTLPGSLVSNSAPQGGAYANLSASRSDATEQAH